MANRIQHLFDECAESPRIPEYFVVAGEFGQVLVSRATARGIRTSLARFVPPRWIEIRSVFGATWQVRSRAILTVSESTVAQRAAMRQFWKHLDAEESAESNPFE